MENPVRRARLIDRKTLREYAEAIPINYQALFLTEEGCYPSIPPVIVRFLINRTMDGEYACSLINNGLRDGYRKDYAIFQEEKRRANGMKYGLSMITLGPPNTPPGTHPVAAFRRSIGIGQGHPEGLSRMGFCKTFCIASSELYNLEDKGKKSLSEQFKTAMRQAGLPATVLADLVYRCQEFA